MSLVEKKQKQKKKQGKVKRKNKCTGSYLNMSAELNVDMYGGCVLRT